MSKPWLNVGEFGFHHVMPLDDLVEHDLNDEGYCVCVPLVDPVQRDDGTIGWIYVHHSLDGREANE